MAETGRALGRSRGRPEDLPAGAAQPAGARRSATGRRSPQPRAAIAEVEAKLAGRGRLLVRYSGTEPLLRVMIEGERQEEIQRLGGTDRRRGRGPRSANDRSHQWQISKASRKRRTTTPRSRHPTRASI
ncbi:MAG: hypothetical protein MZU84_04790 [Sphingobacterium sp.]|nr:hypothetical protein [Sphingobacterium sp.]